jgi:hypothetical protein
MLLIAYYLDLCLLVHKMLGLSCLPLSQNIVSINIYT